MITFNPFRGNAWAMVGFQIRKLTVHNTSALKGFLFSSKTFLMASESVRHFGVAVELANAIQIAEANCKTSPHRKEEKQQF